MSERRLTTDELSDLDMWAADDLRGAEQEQVWAATEEIRERRARDLTAEDVEALKKLADAEAMGGEIVAQYPEAYRLVAALYDAIDAATSGGDMPVRDDCAFCRGAKGGTPGNENLLPTTDGKSVIVCDYCTVLVRDLATSGGGEGEK